jgi:TatD DNase family protein
MLVDTHCHIDADRFDDDRPAILARARDAGVEAFINVGCDSQSSKRSLGLAATHPDVWAAVGHHPHEARHAGAHFEDELFALAAHRRCVAIGECGLDFHYDHSPRDVQRDVFARQIDVARQVKKPLVLHIREAFDEALVILAAHKAHEVSGVFHCFTGTVDQARRALDLGFTLSLPGVVTFKNAGELVEVAKLVPRDRVVVETDAPYMAPAPHRGKRNEPAFVSHTAAFVAEVRGEDRLAFIEATGQNARRLFGLSA